MSGRFRYGVMRSRRCRETNSGDPYCPRVAMAVTENTFTAGALATGGGWQSVQEILKFYGRFNGVPAIRNVGPVRRVQSRRESAERVDRDR
jgi:hypothetical protein